MSVSARCVFVMSRTRQHQYDITRYAVKEAEHAGTHAAVLGTLVSGLLRSAGGDALGRSLRGAATEASRWRWALATAAAARDMPPVLAPE